MVVIGGSVPKAGTRWRAAVQEGFERDSAGAARAAYWRLSWATMRRWWVLRKTCWTRWSLSAKTDRL